MQGRPSGRGKCGQIKRTVSRRGSAVSPPRIFQTVVKGAPHFWQSAWTSAHDSCSRRLRTSVGDGISWGMPPAYRNRYGSVNRFWYVGLVPLSTLAQ